ncbi:MAG: transglutaminase domain-containing protein [Bacteroidetes bacterium]|nr:transglutaminase domain-containing protein [Bacteroidota bacterium]
MKKLTIFSLTILTLFWGCKTQTTENKQSTYKGLPLIKAKSTQADYRLGNDWEKGSWTISPQIEFDSLLLTCHSDSETFAFYTDLDSISFKLLPEQIHKFYVSVNDTTYALTVVKGIKPNFKILQFDATSKNNNLTFWYEPNNNNEYLNLLRSKYPIDSLIKDTKTDTEKTQKILHWVHNQWQHNGNNEPRKSDAISILEEVKEGKNFRCVEYGIVATACLNAVGLKARTLGLKTKDVETRQYGAGHVLVEVFLNDLKKWVLIDGQWDAMPVLNDIPLNAVEFQKAIAENFNELEIRTSSDLSKNQYIDWIYPYLYYFDVSFDNREGINADTKKINRKSRLMLVPVGAINPTIFQITYKIDDCLYTNSLNDFYAPPNNIDK